MSIRRTVKLLLDQAAARKVERDTQRALVKGTDSKRPVKQLGKVGRALKGLSGQAKAMGASLIAAFAVRRIQQYITTVLSAFGRQERAILRVNSALLNMGQFTEENAKFLQDHAAGLQRITTAGDEAILEATATIGDLAKELTVGELAKAQEAAIALADTFFDGNLSSAASLLAKTLGSSTNALSRYGIEIDTAATQSEKLEEILGITNDLFLTSQRAAVDLTGRTAQLSNSWGDMHEAIGRIISRGLGLTGALGSIREFVDRLTASLERNQGRIADWGQFIIKVMKATFESVRFVIRAAFNVGQVIGSAIEAVALGLQQVYAPMINRFLDLIDKIPLIDIPFRMNELTPEEFAAESKRLADNIKRDFGDMADAVFDLGDAYRNVGIAAVAAAKGQVELAEQIDIATIGRPAEKAVAELDIVIDEDAIRERRARAEELQAEQIADFEKSQALLRRRASQTADGMTRAFQGFFEATGVGFAGTREVWAAAGEAARGVGASIVSAMVSGRVETEMALGTAALASGLWPPNPAAIASGLKHFAAAALFKAIPGVIGGGGGGGGGGLGGGFGGPSLVPAGAVGGGGASSTAISTEVNIFIDPLSASDPAFQRATLGAIQSAQERFGDNIRVNVRPRTGRN